MSLPLTAIILAHQEHHKLLDAIHSVSWAEEVLVVWTAQTPAPHIQAANIRVVHWPQTAIDFAQIRNQAIHTAHCDWIVFLDSDEELAPDTASKIQHLLQIPNVHGAYFHRRDIFLGQMLRWGEVHDVRLVRLFRKDVGQFERAVHEVACIKGQVIDSDVIILHRAHDSISAFFNKIIVYTQQEATLRRKHHEHVSILSLFLWPTGKFLYNFFWKLGFLDGWRGFIYALLMSIHSFSLRALLYEQQS